ncbi:MAG TPA: hypothetical protein VJZ93_03155 [Candidatus Nanoarchaeia archaeon]|nr:hypothetical protein [Candidatus Nanoarchaeia archaeon]
MELGVWMIVFFLIIVVFLIIKLINAKQNLVQRFVLLVFVLLTVSIGYTVFTNDIEISDSGDIIDLAKIYFSWVGSIFGNLKDITADAIHLDWNPISNKTAS